jgi:hypothetical protein
MFRDIFSKFLFQKRDIEERLPNFEGERVVYELEFQFERIDREKFDRIYDAMDAQHDKTVQCFDEETHIVKGDPHSKFVKRIYADGQIVNYIKNLITNEKIHVCAQNININFSREIIVSRKKHFTKLIRTRQRARTSFYPKNKEYKIEITHTTVLNRAMQFSRDIYELEIELLNDHGGAVYDALLETVQSICALLNETFDHVKERFLRCAPTIDLRVYKFNKPIVLLPKNIAAVNAVTPKIDGQRVFLFFCQHCVYEIDTNFNVRVTTFRTARAKDTVLDAEKAGATYYVFDALTVDGRALNAEPFSRRYLHYTEYVQRLNDKHFVAKRYFTFTTFAEFVDANRRAARRYRAVAQDGLIYVHTAAAYASPVYKWKHEATIDFYNDAGTPMLLCNRRLVHDPRFVFRMRDVVPAHQDIVECRIEQQFYNEAVPIRLRKDKKYPNTIEVANSILQTKNKNYITAESLRGNDVLFMRMYHNKCKQRYYEMYKGDYLLDIGSGVGADVFKWKHTFKHVTCIEPNEQHLSEMLSRLARNHQNHQPNRYHESPKAQTERLEKPKAQVGQYSILKKPEAQVGMTYLHPEKPEAICSICSSCSICSICSIFSQAKGLLKDNTRVHVLNETALVATNMLVNWKFERVFRFDVISVFFVLNQIPRAELPALIANFARLGLRVIGIMMNSDYLTLADNQLVTTQYMLRILRDERLFITIKNTIVQSQVENLLSFRELTRLMHAAGFTLEHSARLDGEPFMSANERQLSSFYTAFVFKNDLLTCARR